MKKDQRKSGKSNITIFNRKLFCENIIIDGAWGGVVVKALVKVPGSIPGH